MTKWLDNNSYLAKMDYITKQKNEMAKQKNLTLNR